jgi:hypothetical protein
LASHRITVSRKVPALPNEAVEKVRFEKVS